MVPILIEPAALSFSLATNNVNFQDAESEIDEFKGFLTNTNVLFDQIKENGLRIVVTEKLIESFQESVPVNVYQLIENKSIQDMARDLFWNKLYSLYAIADPYLVEELGIEFVPAPTAVNPFTNNEEYTNWLKLLPLVLTGRIPPWIMQSKKISFFSTDSIQIKSGELKEQLLIYQEIEDLIASDLFRSIQFASKLKPNQSKNIKCTGTGTHSSIWKKPIMRIGDIPPFERELIEKFCNIGIVNAIRFLDFNKKNYPAPESPEIIINSIEEKQSGDILTCTLRGHGKKKHCQEIQINLIKGVAQDIINHCGRVITIKSIDNLTQLTAVSENYL